MGSLSTQKLSNSKLRLPKEHEFSQVHVHCKAHRLKPHTATDYNAQTLKNCYSF